MKATLYCLLFIIVLGQNNTVPKTEKNSIKQNIHSWYAFHLDPEEEIYTRTNQMLTRLGIDTLLSDPLVKGYCKMDSNQQDFILSWMLTNKKNPMPRGYRKDLKTIFPVYDHVKIYPKMYSRLSFIVFPNRHPQTVGYTFLNEELTLRELTGDNSFEEFPKETKGLNNRQLILRFAQNMIDAGKGKEEVIKAIQALPIVSSTKKQLEIKQKGNNVQLAFPVIIEYGELYLNASTSTGKDQKLVAEDSVKVGWAIDLTVNF